MGTVIAEAAACAATIVVSQQDDQTLSGTTYYQMVINNGRHIMSSSGFQTTIVFNSSSYSFSLTNYNPALMTMISATLDLERLAASSLSFTWTVSPDPGEPWRPHAYAPSQSYTFVTISAPAGSGASYSFGLGPNTPVTGFDMLPLFASDINSNIPIQITWQQSLEIGACYDGSCGGTAYWRSWPGAPAGRVYELSLTGHLHTWVQAELTLDNGVAEPATFALLGGGLLAIGLLRRRLLSAG